MDINFQLDNKVFNYRVAAIIKHDNKYLVTKHEDKDYLSFIGGRVKIGETSIETAIREAKEETGFDVLHVKTLGIIENFFTSSYNNKEYHEILILQEIEFIDKSIYELDNIPNKEGKSDSYIWVSIEELKQNLKPKEIIKHLEDKTMFHEIIKD